MQKWVVLGIIGLLVFGFLGVGLVNAENSNEFSKKDIDENTVKFDQGDVKVKIVSVKNSKGFLPLEDDYPPPREMIWTAATNLVRRVSGLSAYPVLYAYSRSRWEDNGYPADIQRIGLRTRVWKKIGDNWQQIYWNQVDKYNDSDANIYWAGTSYGGGEYFARSNHWFEANSVVNWYPVTEDSCTC